MHRLLVTATIVPSSPIVTLKKEGINSYETSVLTRATWCNIPEDAILHYYFHFQGSESEKLLIRFCLKLKAAFVMVMYTFQATFWF
jgi:hypothetical protein